MLNAETIRNVDGYRVVRRLASGSVSDVLLAHVDDSVAIGREVVFKVLHPQFSDDDLARILEREHSAQARLSHSSIVRWIELLQSSSEEYGEPRLVVVLEYVDGPPLSRLRTMAKAVGVELDDRAAIHVAARLFDALAAAHAAVDETGLVTPIVHRDVNPTNLLVSWDGDVKLTNFGMSTLVRGGLARSLALGNVTYGYMSPEQVTGGSVTPRADVYAAGIVLWELLAKRRAFQRGAVPESEALRAIAEPRLVPLDTIRPDVDEAVRDAVHRALEPRASHRRITAEEMASILSAVVSHDEGHERLVRVTRAARSAPILGSTPPPNGPSMRPPNPRIDSRPVPRSSTRLPTQLGLAPPPDVGFFPRGGSSKPVPVAPLGVPRRTAPPAVSSAPATGSRPAGIGAMTLDSPFHETPKAPRPSPSRPATRLGSLSPEGVARGSSARTNVVLESTSPSMEATLSSAYAPDPLAKASPADTQVDIRPEEGRLEAGRKEDVDEILRGVLSSMPSSAFDAAGKMASSSGPSLDEGPETARALGQLPAAPTPLRPARPAALLANEARPTFDTDIDRTYEPTLTSPRSPDVHGGVTDAAPSVSRTLRIPAPVGPTAATPVSVADPPPPVASEPNAGSSRDVQPPLAPSSRDVVPPQPMSSAGLLPLAAPKAMDSHPEPVLPSGRRGSNAGAIAALVTLAVGASLAAAGAIVQYRRTPSSVASSGPTENVAPAPSVRHRAVSANVASTGGVAPASAASIGGAASASAASIGGAASASAASTGGVAPASAASTGGAASASVASTGGIAPPSLASADTVPSTSVSAPQVSPPPFAKDAGAIANVGASRSGTASVEAPPEGMGYLKTTGALPGRRIFVDDRSLGQTPESIAVKCGTHSVRLGSAGKAQTIVVPCGGAVGVADRN